MDTVSVTEIILNIVVLKNSRCTMIPLLDDIIQQMEERPLGMGTNSTWHGKPDSRLRGQVMENLDVIASGGGNENDDSNGGTVTVDGKRSKINKAQLVATVVTFTFSAKFTACSYN